jgi:2-oxoglutarate dehydrogenase E1 component
MQRFHGDLSAKTAVPAETLKHISKCVTSMPTDFTPHAKIKRLLATREQAIESGKGLDWGNAESLAMGSLLLEGHWVRLMGQDVERGTVSHRHAILYDFNNNNRYVPLAHLSKDQGHITITNSMLSELAVLGFEYGYTLADPRPLVMWEAQFGDFVNGAQPIIDQFIVAGESKWQLMSGLVMLLPHGYEGQGPEHSNAYVERWLSLCAENNIQVATPTTPAQYFHLLRRQIHRKFRKPLVLFMPKGLLRYEPSFSTVADLTEGHFHAVLDDPQVADKDKVRRVLLCTGKVYYTLQAARGPADGKHADDGTNGNGDSAAGAGDNVAVIRVEQLYPFCEQELRSIVEKYHRVEEIAWVQEEPRNRGAWTFMEPRLRAMFPDTLITYFGRDESASPAVGSVKAHQIEEKELVSAALGIRPQSVPVAKGTPATATTQTAASQ